MSKQTVGLEALLIEVTRRCNMKCEHCLRGKAQPINMKKEYIDKLFSQVHYISSITFTGGEPSLCPEIIEYALESAKHHKVSVGDFYIVTNGKKITEEFVVACLKWYAYCDDNETSGVEVSNDDFHDAERNYKLLLGLSFFSEREQTSVDKVIPEGRAKDWGSGRKVTKEEFIVYKESDGSINVSEGIVYLNCKGKLVGGCDWSYANQNRQVLCDVGELSLKAFEDWGSNIE